MYNCAELRSRCMQHICDDFHNLNTNGTPPRSSSVFAMNASYLSDTTTGFLMKLQVPVWKMLLTSDLSNSSVSTGYILGVVLDYCSQFIGDKGQYKDAIETLLPLIDLVHVPAQVLWSQLECNPLLQEFPIVHVRFPFFVRMLISNLVVLL